MSNKPEPANRRTIRALGTGALLLTLAGCGAPPPPPPDVGNNDPNVIVALGDSITAGRNCGGTPYPEQLALLCGKTVINAGIGGERTAGGLNRISGVLATNKPGFILILYGSNDAIMRRDSNTAASNILAMVQLAKANKTVPIVATLPPMIGPHRIYNQGAARISAGIRAMALRENVQVVDLRTKFSHTTRLLMPDGLHPNDLGGQVIAQAFRNGLANAGAFSPRQPRVLP